MWEYPIDTVYDMAEACHRRTRRDELRLYRVIRLTGLTAKQLTTDSERKIHDSWKDLFSSLEPKEKKTTAQNKTKNPKVVAHNKTISSAKAAQAASAFADVGSFTPIT